MKKLKFYCSIFFLLILSFKTFGQITGVQTIPGTYPTIAAAVADLNSVGVGPSGATINVAAGHTETLTASLVLTMSTNSPTAANPLVIQKSGAGANPLITAHTGTGTLDGIFILNGVDYVSIDGISIQENAANVTTATQMEWGFALLKTSVTNGASFNTIKNCVITLNKTNTASKGIYSANHTTAALTALTITANGGTNSYNRFLSNTIQNSYIGYTVNGFASVAPFDFYDQNNQIGKDLVSGNRSQITDFGGAAVVAAGIQTTNQNYLRVFGTNINGGAGTTAALSGISIGAATNANVDIYNDTITLVSAGTTGAVNGITNAAGGTGAGSTINIYNNVVSNSVMAAATTLEFRGIASTATASYTNIYNNTVSNNTQSGTGQFSCIHYAGSSATLCLLVNIYGNTVSNNSKTGTAGQFNCIFASASTNTTNVYNNTMSNNNSSTSSGAAYGYYNFGFGYNENIYNNTVNDLIGGSGEVSALNVSSGSGPTNKEVYGNTIFNISGNTATTVAAIVTDYGTITNIYRNRIYNITNNTATGAAPASAGIFLAGLSTVNVVNNIYNNYVSDIKAPNATNATIVLSGIHITGTAVSAVNAYNNTVYLNATGTGAAFNTAALFFGTLPVTVDLRNNILVNVSTPNGTGITRAITRGGAGITNYSLSSGYNCLFAGTPSATNVLFHDGTTGYPTLQEFKNVLSPREQATFSSLPPFVNVATAPYDLHLQTSIATGCESGGQPNSLVTVDYDGNSRNVSTPDVGADEIAGIGVDNASPNIQYTLLGNGNVAATRTVTNFATITDLNGINTSAGTKPRLYYKKSTQANTYNDNTNTTDGWKYVEVSNAASPFSFTIDYNLLLSGAVVAGDIIQYFVVAQDLNGTPNFGINAGGLTVQPVSVNLAAANFPLLNTINQYTIVANALSGTINVGPTETITSLTNAGGLFQTVNAATLTGNLTVNITGDLTAETGTFALNQWPEVGTGNYTMTIVPSAAATRLISGTSAAAMVRFDGADRVTVDGRFGGSGRFLTFRNTSTASPVISYLNDAQNNNLQYTIVESGNTATSATLGGAIYIGTTVATGTGNDNISINNNEIRDRSDVLGTPSIAINCVGNVASTLAAYNNNVTISNNDIHDWFLLNGNTQFAVNIGAGNSGFTISNNSFYQTATRTHTVSGAITRAINISFASTVNSNGGHTISGNFIGGTAPGATGGDMTTLVSGVNVTQVFVGIAVTSGLITNTIQNNTIRNINFTTNSPAANTSMWLGISAAQGNFNINGNTIGTDLATNNVKININAGGASSSFLAGILATGAAGSFTIQNNKIGGINVGGTSVTGGIIPQWIQVQGTPSQTVNVSNNLIGSTTVANSISYTSAANVISFGYRQTITSGAALNFTGNTIQNISDNSTATGSIHYGALFISTVGGSGLVNASNNTIRDLSHNGTAATPSISLAGIAVQNLIGIGHNINNNTIAGLNVNNTGAFQNYAIGIQLQSNALGGTISQNKIFGFRNNNTGATVGLAGIYINSGLDWSISNNMISLNNGANTNNIDLTGISEFMGQSGNLALYYNSIYLGGSVAAGATNSASFLRGGLSKATVKNNLFYNERSGGTGAHLALSSTNNTGWSSNNNAFIVGDITKVAALGIINYDFVNWKINAGTDANSISTSNTTEPSSALFVNANAGDLHINTSIYPEALGTPIAGITVDYDGNTRSLTTPTIGADELACSPVLFTLNSQTNLNCFGDSNGSASIIGTGGNGLTYNWSPTGGNTNTATGLTAGNYTCTINNLCGNTGVVLVTISQPAAISLTPNQTNVSCFGGSNGVAAVSPSGGNPSYTYSWSPFGGSLATASGLSEGAYAVTVTDANGCTATQNFTVTQPTAISVTPASQTNVSCFGGTNGAASINTPTGGAGGFTYNWTPGNPAGDGTTSVTGLSAGTWTCNVTDANGCTATQNFIVTQPTAISVTAASQTNVSCNGGSNGAASINTPTGGAGGFTYNWTPGTPTGDGTTTVTGLTAGSWSCTVTDANGCTAAQTFTVTQPTAISVTPASQTNVSCNGGSNGAASINTPTGGAGGFTYNWTPGTPTGDGTTSVTGLTAGSWTCTVTDANGCVATQSFTITEQIGLVLPTLPTVTDQCSVSLIAPVTNNACAGTTTGITTTVFPITTQGTTVVTWSFNDGNGNTVTATQTVIVDDVTNPTTPTLATVTGQCSATVTAPTTTDNCAGTITGTTTDPLTYSTQGTFTVNWTFNDGNGNSITVPQTVIVDDVTNPSTPTLAAVTGECSATVTAPTTSDNCAGTITGTTTDPLTYSTQGTFTVNWTFNDGNGNSITVPQTVIVDDVTSPVADVAVLTAITECYEATLSAPTATDNCTGTTVGIPDVTFPISAVGSTIVTWTYTDGNGNTSTQTQNVIINTVDNSVTQAVTLLTANAPGSIYQWLDCDNGNSIIAGETNQSYTPAITGNYAVEVTQNGCVDTSACFLVDYTGIENLTSTNLLVYPNPSIDGYFNIQFEGTISEVELFDLLGRTIMVTNVEQGTLNGSSLSAGKYFIHIYTDKGLFVEQLVIAK